MLTKSVEPPKAPSPTLEPMSYLALMISENSCAGLEIRDVSDTALEAATGEKSSPYTTQSFDGGHNMRLPR